LIFDFHGAVLVLFLIVRAVGVRTTFVLLVATFTQDLGFQFLVGFFVLFIFRVKFEDV